MSTTIGGQPATPRFQEISQGRCAELLAGNTVGRVAWNSPDGPQLLPVTYAMYDHRIVLRTSPYGALSQLASRREVAFEVDELDKESNSGWSVVVRGTAEAVAEPAELVKMWALDGLVPWATGVRNLFISITPRSISGRTARAVETA